MVNTNDLRVKRTLEAIKQAFIELVEERGFDKVTVRDITVKANINRGTFYAHYEDKYDLINKYEQQLIEELYQFSPMNRSEQFKNSYQSGDSHSFTLPLFQYIKEHYRMIRVFIRLNNGLSFQKKMKLLILDGIIHSNGNSEIIKAKDLRIQKEYLLAYSVSAHMGLIIEWLERDCIEPPEQVAEMLWTLAKYGTMYAAGIESGGNV